MNVTPDGNHAVMDPDKVKPPEPTKFSELPDDEKLSAAQKLLAAEANKVEVRGYEVCRLSPQGEWEPIIKYKHRYSALQQAKQTADWLNERWPNSLVMVRVIVSAALPTNLEKRQEEPLVLEADEQPQ